MTDLKRMRDVCPAPSDAVSKALKVNIPFKYNSREEKPEVVFDAMLGAVAGRV